MLNRITIYKFINEKKQTNLMKYQPISCSLYDRIESLAVTCKKVQINLIEKKSDVSIIGIIHNVYSENNTEFLLINETKIRLDNIKSISEL